jgi:hypothetical protein
MSLRRLVISVLVFSTAALSGAIADESNLRLNFDNAPSVTLAPTATDTTLDELLSVSPRNEGLNMSLSAPASEGDLLGAVGVGYSDRAYGVNYEFFTNVAGSGADRFGLSGLNTGGLGRGLSLNDELSLNPDATSDSRLWQVGGKVGFGGFSVGADFARESSLTDQAEYRDYRLGLSYAGDTWRVGMQYMRSLQATQENLLGVADALEFGGVWSLNQSIDLVGGVQLWDQQELSIADRPSRDALVFFGTRIQF